MCLYIESATTHDFQLILDDTLVISPKRLLNHWHKEFFKWYNKRFYVVLQMKEYIQHKKIKILEEKRLIKVDFHVKICSQNNRTRKNNKRIFIFTTSILYRIYVKTLTKMIAKHKWTKKDKDDESIKLIYILSSS